MSFNILEISNQKIFEAVKKGREKAKNMIEELGMAELFKKHTLWGKEVSIVGIDGGFHEKVKMEDVNDDEDEIELEHDNNDNSNSTAPQSMQCLSQWR